MNRSKRSKQPAKPDGCSWYLRPDQKQLFCNRPTKPGETLCQRHRKELERLQAKQRQEHESN